MILTKWANAVFAPFHFDDDTTLCLSLMALLIVAKVLS